MVAIGYLLAEIPTRRAERAALGGQTDEIVI
jgi:hypothetical protein